MLIKNTALLFIFSLLFSTSAFADGNKNIFKDEFKNNIKDTLKLNENKNIEINLLDNSATIKNISIQGESGLLVVKEARFKVSKDGESYSTELSNVNININHKKGSFYVKKIKTFMDKTDVVFQGSALMTINKDEALKLIESIVKDIGDTTLKRDNVNIPINIKTGQPFTIKEIKESSLKMTNDTFNNTKNLNSLIKFRLKFDGKADLLVSIYKDNGVRLFEFVVGVQLGDLSILKSKINDGINFNSYTKLISGSVLMSLQTAYMEKILMNLNFSDNKKLLQSVLDNYNEVYTKRNNNIKISNDIQDIDLFAKKELEDKGYLKYKLLQVSKTPLFNLFLMVSNGKVSLNELSKIYNDNFVVTVNGKTFK